LQIDGGVNGEYNSHIFYRYYYTIKLIHIKNYFNIFDPTQVEPPMRLSLLVIISFLLTGLTIDKGPAYHSVTANEGDGVYSLLRRYQLLHSKENINHFYSINDLRSDAQLIKGRTYKLPVLIYPYDGVSIHSSVGIESSEIAERIEAYNRSIVNLGIINSDYTVSKTIWVPMHTMSDRPDVVTAKSEPKPAKSAKSIDVPLFGTKYSTTEVSSEMLKGKVFYLISGHGGPDPGAMSEVGGKAICEDEYAYDVTLRLARKLIEHGATVEVIVQDLNDGIRDDQILTCDKDEKSMGRTTIPIRQLTRLQQRTIEVNRLYKNYRRQGHKSHSVICIHVDSRNPQRRQDVFFYYCEGSNNGKRMAYGLQNTFKEKYEKYRPNRNYSGTVSTRGLYVLRHTDPPAVYIELANIKNPEDLKRILPRENRQALANWIFEGLTN